MKNKYMVLHFSQNWIDGLSVEYCDSEEQAYKYLRNFKTKARQNKDDTIRIVKVLSEHQAEEIDHGLYGFKVKSK